MLQSQKKKIESQQREIENLEKQNEEQRLKIVKILERPKTAPLGALECTICAEEYVEPHLPTRFVAQNRYHRKFCSCEFAQKFDITSDILRPLFY